MLNTRFVTSGLLVLSGSSPHVHIKSKPEFSDLKGKISSAYFGG